KLRITEVRKVLREDSLTVGKAFRHVDENLTEVSNRSFLVLLNRLKLLSVGVQFLLLVVGESELVAENNNALSGVVNLKPLESLVSFLADRVAREKIGSASCSAR